MKHLLAILTVIMLGSTSAHAGLMIEPFVSYGLSGEMDANTNHGVKGDLNFLSFGGRIAYKMLGLFVGGEYAIYNEAEIDNEGTAGTGTFKYAMNGISLIAGYEAPILFRVYGGYTLSYSGTLTGTQERDVDGTGFFLGVGYSIVPMVSLNVEYRSHTLDETKLNGTTTTLTDASDNQIMIGVSVPLGIPLL